MGTVQDGGSIHCPFFVLLLFFGRDGPETIDIVDR